ncbi:MAG: thiamine pyrophosphate-dependent enzyme [Clostridia bacterium]|nr:thiamine pyrophosphate-dependent enzyme [Clostridia bacterium]
MFRLETETRGLVAHGVSACAGCGMELVIRNVLDVLGQDTIIVIPPGCSALFCGFGRETGLKIAGFQGNLENTAAYAAGIRAGLEVQGNTHTTVLGFAGDGGTVDIGFQALSGMIERGDRVLYICYDNEAYMNTGIQGSSSTPMGASTTTTPGGKLSGRKDLISIVIAHDIPYAATASIANLTDLRKKIQKAKDTDGPSVVHVHTPCPTGWAYPPAKSIEVCRKAVETGAWLLYEYDHGKYSVNYKKPLKPVSEYLKMQGRFKHVTDEDVKRIEETISARYEKLIRLEG